MPVAGAELVVLHAFPKMPDLFSVASQTVVYLPDITLLVSLMSSADWMRKVFWEISGHPFLPPLSRGNRQLRTGVVFMMSWYAVRSCWDGKGCGNVGKVTCVLVVPWEER